LQALLQVPPDDNTPMTVMVTAKWQFADGTHGFASASIKVMR
jgi:hypothetical protein